jgi:hypothetical protein
MRKTLGLLCAAAMMLPIGVIAANAAGGAAALPTCTAAAGTFKFTPPLPASGGVISNLSSAGTVTGCTGGGVKSGHTTFKQTVKSTTKGSCATLAKPTGKPTVGLFTVTWNTGKTSTAKVFNVTQSKTTITNATTTGKITSGMFVGKTITGTVTFALKTSGSGSSLKCTGGTYKNAKGVKFVIK